MQEFRCGKCNRKLGMGIYTKLAIKCPRCGALNVLRAESPAPECHRASNLETHYGKGQNPQT